MFKLFKKNTEEKKRIDILERTNKALRDNLTEEIKARNFAETNYEESIQSRIADLQKFQEILNSKKHWKQKEKEITNYVELALDFLKGKEN